MELEVSVQDGTAIGQVVYPVGCLKHNTEVEACATKAPEQIWLFGFGNSDQISGCRDHLHRL